MQLVSEACLRDTHGQRYQVVRPVGAGAQGEVYECVGPRARRYALKVYQTALSGAAANDRIDRLVGLSSSLRNPVLAAPQFTLNCMRRVGHFAPWASGRSLADWYDGPTWSLQEGLLIAAALARGLAEVEALGLAHGDLQPGNVHLARVEQHFEVRLVDFDNAVIPGAPPPGFIPPDLYQAPELVAGHRADGASDRWSLAVLFHELLTLKRPFCRFEDDVTAYHQEIESGRWGEDPLQPSAAPTAGLPSGIIGASLASMFRRALSRRRSDRPGAREWCERLLHASRHVWSCDRCGRQLVAASDTRQCLFGEHSIVYRVADVTRPLCGLHSL